MWSHCWRAWDPMLGTGCKTLMATKSNCFTHTNKFTGKMSFSIGVNGISGLFFAGGLVGKRLEDLIGLWNICILVWVGQNCCFELRIIGSIFDSLIYHYQLHTGPWRVICSSSPSNVPRKCIPVVSPQCNRTRRFTNNQFTFPVTSPRNRPRKSWTRYFRNSIRWTRASRATHSPSSRCSSTTRTTSICGSTTAWICGAHITIRRGTWT